MRTGEKGSRNRAQLKIDKLSRSRPNSVGLIKMANFVYLGPYTVGPIHGPDTAQKQNDEAGIGAQRQFIVNRTIIMKCAILGWLGGMADSG